MPHVPFDVDAEMIAGFMRTGGFDVSRHDCLLVLSLFTGCHVRTAVSVSQS
jgi:hypothetical protein